MILNKLNDNQLKRLNNKKEQKVYEFILNSRQNELNDKFIYHLTLHNNEEIIAQFNTEIELEEDVNGIKEKFCELSFIVIKVLKKNKESKLRKNKILYINYKNVFKDFTLIDDGLFTEVLTLENFLKYDFEESFNVNTIYNSENNTVKMYLFFHPWIQKEKFKLSPKTDVNILISFFNVDNAKMLKTNDSSNWEIKKVYIKNNKVLFKINSTQQDWLPEEELDEISFGFDKAELKVVKDEYLYYYKGKYVE